MPKNTLKSRIGAFLPESIKRRRRHWLNILSTEYNFRFRRHETKEFLKQFRQVPKILHIEGTNVCNARCIFCAYPQMQRPKQVMSMEDFRRIVDEYVAIEGQFVSLSPIVGDPFVDRYLFDRLDDLYQREQIKGFYFYTNAILMKPEVSERLLKYASKLTVHVSWGGFDRETYKTMMGVDKFDIGLENVEAFVEMKRKANLSLGLYFAIHLRCPSSSCNGEAWERFRKYRQENLINTIVSIKGYDSWAGKIAVEDLRKVGLEPFEPPHKRGACELLFMKPVVLANGKVNACACRDVEAELIVGDLKNSKLSEIWAGKGIDDIIERQERGVYPDVCRRCTYYTSVYNRRNTEIFNREFNWRFD